MSLSLRSWPVFQVALGFQLDTKLELVCWCAGVLATTNPAAGVGREKVLGNDLYAHLNSSVVRLPVFFFTAQTPK